MTTNGQNAARWISTNGGQDEAQLRSRAGRGNRQFVNWPARFVNDRVSGLAMRGLARAIC